MDRVTAPKTSFLATRSAEVAGCGFIAQHRDLAMLHAVEIAPKHRRQGLATQIMGSSIHWCKRHGVEWIALIARRDNEAANRLYQAIGMRVAMQYHYRIQIRASHTGAIGT